MELVMDLVKVIFRIVTILPLMLIVTLFMGKRSIGELPVFDFLVILTLGSVVGADIADPNVHHLPTVGAIIAIALLQKLIAWWKMQNHKVGRLLSFEPTLVIYEGQFHIKNMRKISYSIDNILQMLREKDVFRLEDVHFALIEANGELSVKLKPEKELVKKEDLQSAQLKPSFEYTVIMDGRIQQQALEHLGLDEAWLREELLKGDIVNMQDVFYAAINEENRLNITMRNPGYTKSIPIFH
ncbi:DUF421 domain-containing protein [Sutcliffiella horikoshii]|uniref:DUF421 domain-containing protein n=1 Tax=Sutcliffiella horikoshii TaxID=79883 RepID=UPI001F3F10C5|nr:DUF421 domain-containing protein [Sutcliffiella horikoshii]MCG1022413.1 DUF421 domain-containing protein [Sutcliffiella horikoshii]